MIDIFDFYQFAHNFLYITDKSGQLIPFRFNRAQEYVYQRLEEQRKQTGMIRALILKGRQQGISTFVQGYFFHGVLTKIGTQAFIMTHHADATRNLFDMTKRYDDNLPEGLAPKPSQKSHNRLTYDALQSGYRVGTAGSKQTGRSMTAQRIHCSEYAFYDDVQSIKKGLLQTVADLPDTAIIKESTANGQDNAFCEEWEAAVKGESNYIAIFVPWYWQDEYKINAKEMRLTDEEKDLMDLYGKDGLTPEHLAWRRMKLSDFDGDHDEKIRQFDQEYPFTAADAFISSIKDAFISVDCVRAARKRDIESTAKLIIGVDPAISDKDRCTIMRRKGRKAYGLEKFYNLNTMEIVAKLEKIIKQENPTKVFIDCIGIGAGVVDRLQEMGYSCVEAVDVRRKANDKDKYGNLRAELWSQMKEWLINESGVQIPDDIELQKDLTSYGFKYNNRTQLFIESKEEAKKRGVRSSDCSDSLAHTFCMGEFASDVGDFYNPAPTGYNEYLS